MGAAAAPNKQSGAEAAAAEEDFRLAIVPVTEPAGWRRQPQQQQQDVALPTGSEAEGEQEDEELSDLESDEEDLYLHTPEEAKLKELIWTELNKDYLERQSAKAAAQEAAAAKVGSCCLLAFWSLR